jgi:hypothetical protein
VELLESLREQHTHDSLGPFAAGILAEIETDRAVLATLTERIGSGPSAFKEATAWLAERMSRLKLRRGSDDDLASFESLELLALGVLGKVALWDALATIAPGDARLKGLDFSTLAARARAQHAKVEEQRLIAARRALRASAD